MSANSDFKELLRIFKGYQVKYLIIGGYAVMKYTEPRYTKHLDLWVEANPENAERVYNALLEFGAPLEGMSSDDFAHEGYFYQMGIPPVRVDLLMSIKAMAFPEAWPNRVETDFAGVPVSFISREDLIRSKEALGRPQDLVDVESLKKSREEPGD